MDLQETALKAIMQCVELVTPEQETVDRLVHEARDKVGDGDKDRLAEAFAESLCRTYAAKGAMLAAPACIPGIGTAAQVAIEGGALTVDTAYMIHYMATMVKGLARIYERDILAFFNDEFLKVLAAWCGVLVPAKGEMVFLGQEVLLPRFKQVPRQIFLQMNRRVGQSLLTKYGGKRVGVALGTLIPFGVGMAIGGGFNLVTMRTFKTEAIAYFRRSSP